ncbi:hypothetical protein BH20ACI1_BH20ACI1_29650 [soil metagenome]
MYRKIFLQKKLEKNLSSVIYSEKLFYYKIKTPTDLLGIATIKLRSKILSILTQNLKVRVAANGQKSLQLSVSPIDLLDGENKITVINSAGAEVGKYDLDTVKK